MSSSRAARPWSDVAIRHLLDSTSCPVCERNALRDRHCQNCGADLDDTVASELWTASQAAAAALTVRQQVLDRVPVTASPVASAGHAAVPVPSGAAGGTTSAEGHGPSATVQSVLAVAGAGLFAIAAIVFTFVNPDLTDRVLRSIIVGVVTVLFLAGAWLLARRGLQFSAEAVGALGMVFIALDVYAFVDLAPTSQGPWVVAALGTLIAGSAMVALSSYARIRSWLWISLLGLGTVPAMLGYAGGTTLSATLGHLGVVFAALAAMRMRTELRGRFDNPLRSERTALAVLQFIAIAIVARQMWFVESTTTTQYWMTQAAILIAIAVLAALTTREIARGFWSSLTGAAGVSAFAVAPFALDLGSSDTAIWYLVCNPAAAALALPALSVLASRARSVERRTFLAGAFTIAGLVALPLVLLAVAIGGASVLSSLSGSDLGASRLLPTDGVLAVTLGLVAMASGFGSFALLYRRQRPARASAVVAVWLATLAGLTTACIPTLPLWLRIAIALGLAVVVSIALMAVPRTRAAGIGVRFPLILGTHFAVLLGAITSWSDERVAVWAGVPVVLAIAAVALAVPREVRFLHVGAGYAYALVVFAQALGLVGLSTIALLCLTTSLASIGAIGATFLRRLRPLDWYAVLTVTSVPFLIGVAQVVFERSGWTALSTGLIFLLGLTLLVSRRPGLGAGLRAIAAGILVPSLAVVVVCLGAYLLVDSASPVTLPVIAAIVALVLPSTALIRSALVRHGIGETDARVARIAIEATSLLTGAIAVVLALLRVAAGLPTTFLVLVVLGIGAAATSFWTKRRYGWWVAGAALTGALWCQLALAGITAFEPYLLPPSLGAAIIGAILTARGVRAVPLYAAGLAVAVVPILVVLAVFGSGTGASVPWRGYGLVAAAWLLTGLGLTLGRGRSALGERVQALRAPTLGVAVVAGAAGAIQGARFGLGTDHLVTGAVPLVLFCFGIGVAGALPAIVAARGIRSSAPPDSRLRRTRWLYAPGFGYVAIAAWGAIERDWFTIWSMWTLMLGYLAAVVAIAWTLRRSTGIRATGLPPVWFVFTIAFITAVVAWSPRDLRVEWFSLPLGLALIAAGAIAMEARRALPRGEIGERGTINSWPARWNGSWALLAPGTVVVMLASIVATFTDPLTWRAILVIVIALVAILIGSSLKLAAPFLIGVVVLPVENVFVFLVQIGRGIESMPWWITLAVVGAVLLIIAVTYERRAGAENSFASRLRDLA